VEEVEDGVSFWMGGNFEEWRGASIPEMRLFCGHLIAR